MHKVDYYIKADDQIRFAHEAMTKKPCGPEFTQEQVDKAERMDVWGSEFHDADEYCEFILTDKKGNRVATSRVEGY